MSNHNAHDFPITQAAKQAVIDAFNAAGITNAEFARRCRISEPMALLLRDEGTHNKIDILDRALRALGHRIDIKIVALLVAAIFPISALAQPLQPWQPPCAITTDITVNTYIGPIEITDLCLTLATYTGGHLTVQAADLSDGIFRDGFDGEGTP